MASSLAVVAVGACGGVQVRDAIISPFGDLGKESLPVTFEDCEIRSMGFANHAAARFDWYNDRLQILVVS